jgi:hypothetical protein
MLNPLLALRMAEIHPLLWQPLLPPHRLPPLFLLLLPLPIPLHDEET